MRYNLEYDKKLVSCTPSEKQIRLQQTEFYAFIHFGMNTFTGREWGDGTERESLFNPEELNASQWVSAVKSAGMKGLILTCKHHDGFCLWPSEYTSHSVKNSPFREGRGDIVRETADACRNGGIKFGVYLSPWDRNNPAYGTGKAYDDYFCNQLTELLTNYGDIFTVWFDGACGEGANGKKQIYDWERYYKNVYSIQPDCCISVCGPDVRWCGNEAGMVRESEWSVIPSGFNSNDEVMAASQHTDTENFAERKIEDTMPDLGSRKFLEGASGLIWKPAEVDVSIRPGWFYHKNEDLKLKSLKRLVDIYFSSVGGNCTLLLNIPPDKRGLISPVDCLRLKQIGTIVSCAYLQCASADAKFTASSDDGVNVIDNVRTDSYDTYYSAGEGESEVTINIDFPKHRKVHFLVIKENIRFSQRIEKFSVECKYGKSWRHLYSGTTVGYKKIARFRPVLTDALRIHIEDSRVCPVISYISVH